MDNPGLLFSKGIGEMPVFRMATFSIWSNLDALNAYVYQQRGHVGAIQQTRKVQWYGEELFSRFQPYRSIGTWGGAEQRVTAALEIGV